MRRHDRARRSDDDRRRHRPFDGCLLLGFGLRRCGRRRLRNGNRISAAFRLQRDFDNWWNDRIDLRLRYYRLGRRWEIYVASLYNDTPVEGRRNDWHWDHAEVGEQGVNNARIQSSGEEETHSALRRCAGG